MTTLFHGLWDKFFDWVEPSLADAGTASLGAAAIFLVRAIPSSNPGEWDLWMMMPVAFFGIAGLILRRLGKT